MDMFRVQLVLFGIFCAACGVESQESSFTVTASPASGTVPPGAIHNMHCRYMITEMPVIFVRVEWYKRPPGGTSVRVWSTEISSSGYVYNQAESEYTRLSGSTAAFSALLTGHSLTITDVQQEDGGEYRCRASYSIQVGDLIFDDSSYIRLVVEDGLVPPNPTLSVYSYDNSGAAVNDIEEGNKTIVECSSPLTTPADDVTFTIYNGTQPVSSYREDTDGRHLCRAEVTFSRSDNRVGNWLCRATWKKQHYDSSYLSVDVLFAARRVSIVQPFPSDPVALGTQVSSECATDSANPTPVIIWRRSSVAIQDGDTYSIVPEERDGEYNAKYRTSTLSFVAAQEHRGRQFDCIIQDQSRVMPAGSTLMLKTNLQVQIQGYSGPLHVGESLSLTCKTDQDGDNPTFTWTFTQGGQNSAVSNAQTHTIQSVQSSDAGDYTCEASTDTGAGKATITVVVQEAISPTPVPTTAPPPIQTMTTTSKSQTPSSLTTLDSQQTTATDGLNRNGGDANESSSNIGVIAGAAGGGGALIVIIVVIICVMRKKKAASKVPEQELASLPNNTPNVENGQAPFYLGQGAKDKKPQTAVKPSRNTARDSLKKETGKGGSTTPLDQSMERGNFAARLGQTAKELDKGGPVLKSTPAKPESGAASVNPEPFYAQPDLTGRRKKEPVPNTPKADDDDESPDESPDVPNKIPGISKPAVAVKPMAQQQQEKKKKDKKKKAVKSSPPAKPEPEPNEYYNTAQVTAQRTNDKLEQTSLDTDGQMYAEVMTPSSKSVIKPIGQPATEYSAVQFRPGSPGEESDTDSD